MPVNIIGVITFRIFLQVQSAIRRKSSQYRAQWRRRLVTTDSHCNYHTNSSITETSRVIISSEHVPPSVDTEKTCTTTHSLNGQSNGKRCNNGAQEAPKLLELSEI